MSTSFSELPVGHTDDVAIRDRADVVRQIKQIVVFAIITVLMIYFWLSTHDSHITYSLGERVSQDNPVKSADAGVLQIVCPVVGLVALLMAAVNQVRRGWTAGVVYALAGIAFFVSFLIWSYVDQSGSFQLALTNPLPGAIRQAAPLILGALAGCLCERAGVINIAIEGQFLMGAFCASVAASAIYSAEFGLVGGIVGGLIIAWLLAWFSIRFHVNQIVLGVVLTALATGLTDFLVGQIPSDEAIKQYLNEPPVLAPIEIPGLSQIPVIGPALFDQTLLIYLMYVSVVVVAFVLFETKWGLRVRAVGEHPTAADTVGIKVLRIRWQAVLLGGVFAGLGGAFFTVGSTGTFDQNPSNGTGFIALAAVIMGRWHPIGATMAALFFGFMWSLNVQLSQVDAAHQQFYAALPYLAAVIAVAGFVGRVRPPAADGEPYAGH